MARHATVLCIVFTLGLITACSPVGYIVGGIIVASAGGGSGSGPTPRLAIAVGANNPGTTQALTVETDVEVLQLTLAASGKDVDVTGIRFTASGSGHDVNGLLDIRLYRDDDGDGSVATAATLLANVAPFSVDDGATLVPLTETILAGTQVDWLLVYDIGAGPADGENFCVALVDETDVTADAGGSPVEIRVDPGIQGCVTTIRTSLSIVEGPGNPASGTASPCATDLEVLQVRLSSGPEDGVIVDSATFAASGTGDDAVDIAAVRLYADNNGDGALDAGDTQLGSDGVFTSDEGIATFSALSRSIAASGSELWLLTYDFAGAIPVGRTFSTHISVDADVVASAASTSQPIPVTGAPVTGNPVTIEAPVLLSATYLDINDNGLVDDGDTVTALFDRQVVLQTTPLADDVFLFPDPAWTFGPATLLAAGPGPSEVQVVLSGADVQPNGAYLVDVGSTGLNVDPGQTALTDSSGCPVPPLPAPVDLEGEANPHISMVAFANLNANCGADAGDVLQISFSTNVTLLTSDPTLAFQLPVSGDTFGVGAIFEGGGAPSDVPGVRVRLGSGAVVRALGLFDPLTTTAGSPSGLDVTTSPGIVVDAAYGAVSAAPTSPAGRDVASGTATRLWTSSGDDLAGAQFGNASASAGDVNGDGYDDVIIGAHLFDTGNTRAGKAYVYLGGPLGLADASVWESSGDDQAWAYFGNSVASAGDVNGDGYDDVIIGAHGFDTPNVSAGKAYVYLGAPGGLSLTPVWEGSGDDQPNAGFGNSVASAGDVNGDGYDDVIVGAYSFDTGSADAGKAYLYLGGPAGLALTPAWESSGENRADSTFGGSVASAGDVNGDGYDDVIVGAPAFDTTNVEAGKAYVYLGGPGGLSTTPSWEQSGDDQGWAYFGLCVASAGDVNGDGYDDVIIGAQLFDTGNIDAGKAYLYLGGPGGLSLTPAWESSGDDQADAFFGDVAASAGDVDGDGYDDVIIGAPRFDAATTDAGKAYVYLGGPGGLSIAPAWESSGEDQGWAYFGGSVASAGDVNGDGRADVMVGAEAFDTANSNAGKAYVHVGGLAGLSLAPAWESSGDDRLGSYFGNSVASAGDVNGDGYGDLIVGARWFNTTNSSAGKAYVYLGGLGGLAGTAVWESSGDDQGGANFGRSVASAGDVDGDGYDDVIVGAELFGTTNSFAGKAYVYLGGLAGLALTPAWESSGDDQADARFGNSVASAGDVNGDGYDDVIVGAHWFDTAANINAGKAYVYLGGSGGLSLAPAWESIGDDQAPAWFGATVASAGDVNGDGYDDVIVGARGYNTPTPNTNAGKAYVYLGSPGGPALAPAWESSGDDQAWAEFGVSCASAGDVNGDGYSDVIVGAWLFDAANTDAGKAYVYLGGPTGLSTTPAWENSGDDQADASFGNSVASAGDVNGDGYADVIVGASAFDTPLADAGKAYLYLGGPAGPSPTPAWESTGDNRFDANFGYSVGSAGNVAGCCADLIVVGAYKFDTANLNAGKAYVFCVGP